MYEFKELEVKWQRIKPIIKVTNANQAFNFIKGIELNELDVCEHFIAIYLNRASNIITYKIISKGGINGTVADLRIIFCYGLKCLASGLIIAHNHPSENIKPSDSDITLTKKIAKTGKLVEINLIDSLIFTQDEYFSFSNEGLI